ncbi:MAG: hypothetical protein V1746_02690 [bacterium]
MSQILYLGGKERGVEIVVTKVKNVQGLENLAGLVYWDQHGDEVPHICPLARALGKAARAVKYSPWLESVVHHLEIVNSIDDVLDLLSLPISKVVRKAQVKIEKMLGDLSERCGFVQEGDRSLKEELEAYKKDHLNELRLKTNEVKNQLLEKLLSTKTKADSLSDGEDIFPESIKKALWLADRLDEGIHRKFTHAPDICHLLRVAAVTARLSHDQVSPEELEYRVCLALLHDSKENYTGEEDVDKLILEEFGEKFGGRLLVDLEKLTKKKLPKELKKLVEKKLSQETDLDFSKELNHNALKRLFRELGDSVYALGFGTASESACFVKLCDVSANAEDTNEELKINPLRRLRAMRGDGGPLLRYLQKLHGVIAARNLPELKPALDEAWQLLPEKPCELPTATRDVVLEEREKQAHLQGFFFHALHEVLEENKGAEWLHEMEAPLYQAIPVLYPAMEGEKDPPFWSFSKEITQRP